MVQQYFHEPSRKLPRIVLALPRAHMKRLLRKCKVPTKDAEIMAEQQYFDNAIEAYQDSFSLDDTRGTAGDRATERGLQEHFDRRPTLKPDQAVALGRLTDENGQDQYVGYIPIRDSFGDLLVISWKSKAGTKFYEASPLDALGIVRKRTFRTKSNKVLDFEDQHFRSEDIDSVDSEDDSNGVTDDVLEVLRAHRSSTMSEIVRTIQSAQFSIIREDLEQLLVVQGGPGTGKTAVALHRIAWLLFNYRDSLKVSDVLVVGPNETFTNYIANVLPSLGEERVQHTSLNSLVSDRGRIEGTDKLLTARIKGNSGMRTVLHQGLIARITAPTEEVIIQRANSSISTGVPVDKVLDLIDHARDLPYRTGRAQFKKNLMEVAARSMSVRSGVNAEQFIDTAFLENQVNRIWPTFSSGAFLRELLGSRRRLAAAANGALTKDELDALFRPVATKVTLEKWTEADLFLLDEVADLMGESEPLKYRHIVVDEAQDLTGMQMLALKRRSVSGAMTLVGDLAQSTGAAARESWTDVTALLYQSAKPKLRELEVGYRVPREIYEVAQQLLSEAAPGLTPPRIVRDAGESPKLFVSERAQMARCVVQVAQQHARRGRLVAVIAQRTLWPELKTEFEREEMAYADTDNGSLGRSINLVAPESAKGLEFDAVVVVDPQALYRHEHGARLLYIALTRSTSRLDLVAADFDLPSIIQPGLPEPIVFDPPAASETDDGSRSEDDGNGRKARDKSEVNGDRPQEDDQEPGGPGLASLSQRQQGAAKKYVEELVEELQQTWSSSVSRVVLEEALRRLQ